MTRVENRGETHAGPKGLDDVVMYLVVDNVAGLLMVDRVDDFVVSIVLVAVEIFGLSTVS